MAGMGQMCCGPRKSAKVTATRRQRWESCLLDRDDEVGETLRCFNLADGKELWTFAYDVHY